MTERSPGFQNTRKILPIVGQSDDSCESRMNDQAVKVAVVSGGAYGIGRGIVRYFAARGCTVLIADINSERGHALQKDIAAQGGKALFVRTDVRDETSVKGMIAEAMASYGRIDILCNNAGIENYRATEDYA